MCGTLHYSGSLVMTHILLCIESSPPVIHTSVAQSLESVQHSADRLGGVPVRARGGDSAARCARVFSCVAIQASIHESHHFVQFNLILLQTKLEIKRDAFYY